MNGLFNSFSAHSLGHVYEDTHLTVFFGNKDSGVDLGLYFPDFQLLGVHQTHSDIVVASPYEGKAPEADAHISKQRRLALCIRTADCVPVLIEDRASGYIAAIHAGWRGVENEIIRKTGLALSRYTTEAGVLTGARAWIGPHIMAESFEVGLDVAQKLEARFEAVRGYSSEETALRPHDDPEKKRVDLLTIVRAQLRSIGINPDRTRELPIDTFASLEHASFRRDKSQAARQVSFIALK